MTNKLHQLTVLANVGLLIMCHVVAELSPIDSFCEYIGNVSFGLLILPHLDIKCRWEDMGYWVDFVFPHLHLIQFEIRKCLP